ncbi:hypothetical protein ABT117_01660, partial [Streptomyces sp. NPDC002262]|uniref:hypothetical protein n=1 Tax=Streptomyces sp. NPDC002262 TaxID=3154414 RepID=UPI003328A01C
LIDTLTFTICTGQEESRKDGIATIEAIRELRRPPERWGYSVPWKVRLRTSSCCSRVRRTKLTA